MHRLLIVLFIIPVVQQVEAQLECNGSVYRVIEKTHNETTLQKIEIDRDNDRLSLEDLAIYEGHRLNAICYKPGAKSIYGIRFGEPYQLFRISDNLEIEVLRYLPLPTNLFFVAGDIMPDGRHMVVLGYGNQEESNILAIIDLESPNFDTEMIPLKSIGDGKSVVCADIAFHPTTGLLYGFDQRSNKMMRIDLDDRSIHLFDSQVSNQNIGVVPSLFFDTDGGLYGFTLSRDRDGGRQLLRFDKELGTAEHEFWVEFGGSQDACSCPYEVEMYQSVNRLNQYTCTQAQFTIRFVNRTPIMQTDVSLIDTLPLGMTLQSIDYNPYNSTSQLSAGGTIISLIDFDIPIGVDSIVYTVYIDPDMTLGYHRNQSWLLKENPDLRSNLREPLASDDPSTLSYHDATGFLVDDLSPEMEFESLVVCKGELITLNPNVLGIFEYEWNTAETTPNIQIGGPGLYEAKMTSECATGTIIYDVSSADIGVDIGEDMVVDPNQIVHLAPEVNSTDDIKTIIWNELGNLRILSCYTCMEPSARIPKDMGFQLTIENDAGCIATDELFVSVEKVRHYFATGFSPNGDGNNDRFFLQSRKDYKFKDFIIYDRWGTLLFTAKDGNMNDPAFGWDGSAAGQALNPGVYVWSAKILGLDGSVSEVHGDITLVR